MGNKKREKMQKLIDTLFAAHLQNIEKYVKKNNKERALIKYARIKKLKDHNA